MKAENEDAPRMKMVENPSKEQATLMVARFLDLMTSVSEIEYDACAELQAGVWPGMRLRLTIRGPLVPPPDKT